MPIDEKLSTLLTELIAASRAGRVEWQSAGDQAPESYQLDSSAGDAVLIDSRDDDGAPPIDLIVYSPDGTVVGDLKWGNPSSTTPENETEVQLLELFELARDQATGATEVFDRILKEIADPEIPF